MLLHTVVYSSDDFIFKPNSIDKVAGHRFGTDDLEGPLQFRFYLRKLKIRMENLSSLNILINLKKWEVGNGRGDENTGGFLVKCFRIVL